MKTTIFAVLLALFTMAKSECFGLSWRDFKIGATTEEEMIASGGEPYEITLFLKDYLKLKTGQPPQRVRFYYYSNHHMTRDAGLHISKIPVLKGTPLEFSDGISEIKLNANFSDGKLVYYSYGFKLASRPDKKKYLSIFNSLLGDPIRITESSEDTYAEYRGNYLVQVARDYIWLYCPPPFLPR
ncbi:MAG: hypothetical protein FJ123_01395 [Deltaproteobacteria bacterium]|nr:hypothetical protein [Deltaproteobacteria bacterium]